MPQTPIGHENTSVFGAFGPTHDGIVRVIIKT
jgi:hypothetical protein